MRIFKAIIAYFSLAFLILFMDLSQLVPASNIFLVFLIIVPLAYLPWHWYRQGGKDQRLNHLAECFLIIASISLSGRFYLELHGVKQWRYPLAQISPSFSLVLANQVLYPTLISFSEYSFGPSTTQILMTANNALQTMSFKSKFKNNNYSPSWCFKLEQKDCAFKLYQELIRSKSADITTIILGLAVGSLEILKYKNKAVKGLDKKEKLQVLTTTSLDLAKWIYTAVKRSDALVKEKFSRRPSSDDGSIKRLIQLGGYKEINAVDSVGLLKAYDEVQLSIYEGYVSTSYYEHEVFLLENINKAIIYKFHHNAVKKSLTMLKKLKIEGAPEQQAQVDKYISLLSDYQ